MFSALYLENFRIFKKQKPFIFMFKNNEDFFHVQIGREPARAYANSGEFILQSARIHRLSASCHLTFTASLLKFLNERKKCNVKKGYLTLL